MPELRLQQPSNLRRPAFHTSPDSSVLIKLPQIQVETYHHYIELALVATAHLNPVYLPINFLLSFGFHSNDSPCIAFCTWLCGMSSSLHFELMSRHV